MLTSNNSSDDIKYIIRAWETILMRNLKRIEITMLCELVLDYGKEETEQALIYTQLKNKDLFYTRGVLKRRWNTPIEEDFIQPLIWKINHGRMLMDYMSQIKEKLQSSNLDEIPDDDTELGNELDEIMKTCLRNRDSFNYIRGIVYHKWVNTPEFPVEIYISEHFTPNYLLSIGFKREVVRCFMNDLIPAENDSVRIPPNSYEDWLVD